MIELERAAMAAQVEYELRESDRRRTAQHLAELRDPHASPVPIGEGALRSLAAVLRTAGAALDRLAGMLDGAAAPIERRLTS